MNQEEMNAAYTRGREYIEDLFKDGKAVKKAFLWGVFDSIATIITDCGLEESFKDSLDWAKGGGDDEKQQEE